MEKISQRPHGGIQLKGTCAFRFMKKLFSKLSEPSKANILRHGVLKYN